MVNSGCVIKTIESKLDALTPDSKVRYLRILVVGLADVGNLDHVLTEDPCCCSQSSELQKLVFSIASILLCS